MTFCLGSIQRSGCPDFSYQGSISRIFSQFWSFMAMKGLFLGLYNVPSHGSLLFLLSFPSLKLHFYILLGLAEKISLFFINFWYRKNEAFFWLFQVPSNLLIEATGCFLAKLMSIHHNCVNWINNWDTLWKINQIFEFSGILVNFDHFWLFKACFKAHTMLRALFLYCFHSLTPYWGYIFICFKVWRKTFHYFSLIFEIA